jgi:hypothetical protein
MPCLHILLIIKAAVVMWKKIKERFTRKPYPELNERLAPEIEFNANNFPLSEAVKTGNHSHVPAPMPDSTRGVATDKVTDKDHDQPPNYVYRSLSQPTPIRPRSSLISDMTRSDTSPTLTLAPAFAPVLALTPTQALATSPPSINSAMIPSVIADIDRLERSHIVRSIQTNPDSVVVNKNKKYDRYNQYSKSDPYDRRPRPNDELTIDYATDYTCLDHPNTFRLETQWNF